MINIVLFGPPGAGKGTQAHLLVEKYGFNHISTGEILREEIRRGSATGNLVKGLIDKGELAPDSVMMEIMAEYIASHKEIKGNIFDGFPRTRVQAERFDEILAEHGLRVDIMVSLEVSDETLIQRLMLRGMESGRADDGNMAVIRRRIDVYKAQTAIVAKHYAAQDKYVTIDGTGSVEDVFERICQSVDRV